MKALIKIWVVQWMLFNPVTYSLAQQETGKELKTVESYRLEISDTKTTNLIFKYAIVSVDRGNKDVLVQKAKGVENILQVKAASDSMVETNLSVVTADGKLTTFIVRYTQSPESLNISVGATTTINRPGASMENISEAELRANAEHALNAKSYRPGLKAQRNNIGLYLKGIFVHEGVLYFRMRIANWSNIRYDIEQLRFFIRDEKIVKRTASQEQEIVPLYVNRSLEQIAGKSVVTVVFALPKFTIPDQKFMAVQVMEKNGGRHVALKVSNRHILSSLLIK